jgi:tetratricopeptide (TPR) repeat protein
MEVFDEIAIPSPPDAEDDDERVAIGRILTAAGKALQRRNYPQEARFQEAAAFYAATRLTPFARTHYADALNNLGDPVMAGAVLDEVEPAKREAFWALRRSEAYLAQGNTVEALKCISGALGRSDLRERRSTFLAQRADVLFAMGDRSHEAELRDAIEACDPGRYRDELETRLQATLRRCS